MDDTPLRPAEQRLFLTFPFRRRYNLETRSLEPDVTLIRLGRELLLVPGGGMVICSRAQALQQRKVFIRAWLLLMIRLTIGRGGRTAARSLVLLLGAADVLSVAFLHEEVDGAREQSSAPAQQSSVL